MGINVQLLDSRYTYIKKMNKQYYLKCNKIKLAEVVGQFVSVVTSHA